MVAVTLAQSVLGNGLNERGDHTSPHLAAQAHVGGNSARADPGLLGHVPNLSRNSYLGSVFIGQSSIKEPSQTLNESLPVRRQICPSTGLISPSRCSNSVDLPAPTYTCGMRRTQGHMDSFTVGCGQSCSRTGPTTMSSCAVLSSNATSRSTKGLCSMSALASTPTERTCTSPDASPSVAYATPNHMMTHVMMKKIYD